eukprot:756481-Hanusia_phi.AAC.3
MSKEWFSLPPTRTNVEDAYLLHLQYKQAQLSEGLKPCRRFSLERSEADKLKLPLGTEVTASRLRISSRTDSLSYT